MMLDRLALSDAQLIAHCLQRDNLAWEVLVTRYERLVYAIPRKFGLSAPECDDVFQATYLALLKELPKLRHPEAIASWLTVTARRETWRIRWHKENQHSDSADPIPLLETLAEDDENPDNQLEKHEQLQQLLSAVQKLGERCQALIQLLYLNPEPSAYEQVAQQLGLPLGAIGPNRARCLQKLRQLLA